MGLSIEDAASAASELVQVLSDNSETVATVLSLIGLGGTVYYTYKQAPKIHAIVEDCAREIRELQKSNLSDEEVTQKTKEIRWMAFKKAGKTAMPIILCTTITGGSSIAALAISKAKISNLTSIASFAELSYEELATKTKEKVGEEKFQEIQEEIKEDRVKKFSEVEPVKIEQAKGGQYLYLDAFLGTWFRSDSATVDSIFNSINKDLTDPYKDIECDITDIYQRFKIRPPEVANRFVWSRDRKNGYIEYRTNNSITTASGESATVLDYTLNMPDYIGLPFN